MFKLIERGFAVWLEYLMQLFSYHLQIFIYYYDYPTWFAECADLWRMLTFLLHTRIRYMPLRTIKTSNKSLPVQMDRYVICLSMF